MFPLKLCTQLIIFLSTCIQHIAKHKQMTSLKHVYRSFVLNISKYQFAMFRIFKSKSDSSIVKYLLPKFQNQYIIEICLSLFPNWRTVKTFEIMRFIISYFLRNMIREKFSPFNSVRHICYVTYVCEAF